MNVCGAEARNNNKIWIFLNCYIHIRKKTRNIKMEKLKISKKKKYRNQLRQQPCGRFNPTACNQETPLAPKRHFLNFIFHKSNGHLTNFLRQPSFEKFLKKKFSGSLFPSAS